MKVGFIGLGNVGGKLSGSLLRNGMDVTTTHVIIASGLFPECMVHTENFWINGVTRVKHHLLADHVTNSDKNK